MKSMLTKIGMIVIILVFVSIPVFLFNAKSKAQSESSSTATYLSADNVHSCNYTINYRELSGMRYAFIVNFYGGSMNINLTEDSLHCALMRKQLNEK